MASKIRGHSWFCILVSTWQIVLVCGCTSPATRDNRIVDNPAYTEASRLIDIGNDTRLNIYCTGQGSPVVIFEAGLGDSAKAWGLVQPEISKVTTSCAYDRAGLGFSDAAQRAGTSENAVIDLHALLRAADISPPYVLVGHSYGGMNIKLYAQRYTSEVAGLVFVDASHEDLGVGIFALDPENKRKNGEYLENLKRCLSTDTLSSPANSGRSQAAAGWRFFSVLENPLGAIVKKRHALRLHL